MGEALPEGTLRKVPVLVTMELLNTSTPTVEKVGNDFMSLDYLELNQLFRYLQVNCMWLL